MLKKYLDEIESGVFAH